jgi:pyruvate/2-oxoglutarate dehydrogenase complex dihydrolipoamide dehydrogenase (E3) component
LEPDDAHNRRLADHVHPTDWTNPEPDETYNLVAIGAGTAGLVSASGAAGLGAKTALIERNLMGGDCLNSGCVPSKALLRSAKAAADARRADRFGVEIDGEVEVDFGRVMERMRRIRADISEEDSAERFDGLGVDVFLGDATFVDEQTLEVDGQRIRFKKAVIATGGRPFVPPIEGLEEAGYLTNETVFSLTERPDRLAVIGGGPIGCELAQAFQRFGTDVTVVEMADQLLPREEDEAAAIVRDALRDDGVDLRLGAQMTRVEADGDRNVLTVEREDGSSDTLAVDEILMAVGRVPNVEGLGLEAAGVDFDAKTGVEVDDRLQTTNPRIYAAGDVASRYKFTHTADAQARIVIQNALFFGRKKASDLKIPWATYTDPEVAHVGLYPDEARRQGLEVETITQPLSEVHRAVIEGDDEGFLKVYLEAGSDRILGATLVAEGAGDLISELTLAMEGEVGMGTVSNTIHPYPTTAAVTKRAADAYNRTRLTPWIKSIFETWFRWTR